MKLPYFIDLIQRLILSVILIAVPLVVYYGVSDPNILKILTFQSLLLIWISALLVKPFFTTLSSPLKPAGLAYGTVIWLVLSTFALLFSAHKSIGIDRLELLACFVLFFFLTAHMLRNQHTAILALSTAAFGASLVSVYGILQAWGIDFFNRPDLSRVFSTLGHPNFLATYLVCTIPMTLGLFLSGKGQWKCIYGFLAAIQLVCFPLTLSRGAFVSLIAALLFFIAVSRKAVRSRKSFMAGRKGWGWGWVLVVMGTLSLAICTTSQNLHESQVKRFRQMFTPSKENTVWLRWLEWKGALEIIREAPLSGRGIGTFSIYFPPNQPHGFSAISVQRNEFLRHAHNEYLELWCEMGVWGPLIFLFILIFGIHEGIRAFRCQRHADRPPFWLAGIVSGLFGLGISLLFSVSFRFVVTPLIFWFYLGTIYGLSQKTPIRTDEIAAVRKMSAPAILLLAFGLIFMFLTTMRTVSVFKSERAFYKALDLWNSGNLAEALPTMEEALQNNPKKPEMHYKMGALLVRLQRWNEALNTYLLLRKIHPNFFHINYNLSICYLNTGDLSKAIIFGEKELELYPEFAKQHFILGKAYYKLGEYEKAAGHFEKYLAWDPNNADAQIYAANIHSFNGEWEKAITIYTHLSTHRPENFAVHVNLFQAYIDKGDIKMAIDSFCLALDMHYQTSFLENKREGFQRMVEILRTQLDDSAILEACPQFEAFLKTNPSTR